MKKIAKIREIVPMPLPQGVRIAARPADADLLSSSKSRWVSTCQNIAQLKDTEVVEIDIGNLLDMPGAVGKKRLASIKAALRAAYKVLGYEGILRFLERDRVLLVWRS